MCVSEDEETMAPFYMVEKSELPIFAQTDGFVGLAPTSLEKGFKSFTQHLISRGLSLYNNFTIYQYSEDFGNCKFYFGGYNQETNTVPFEEVLSDEETGDVLWGSKINSFIMTDTSLSIA